MTVEAVSMRKVLVVHEERRGCHKLIVDTGTFAEVEYDGTVTVYGSFRPSEIAALVKAAYLLGVNKKS